MSADRIAASGGRARSMETAESMEALTSPRPVAPRSAYHGHGLIDGSRELRRVELGCVFHAQPRRHPDATVERRGAGSAAS